MTYIIKWVCHADKGFLFKGKSQSKSTPLGDNDFKIIFQNQFCYSVKELVYKLGKAHYQRSSIGLSVLLWVDRHTSEPYAFLTHYTLINKHVTNVDTYSR